jgi:hypothetical protein
MILIDNRQHFNHESFPEMVEKIQAVVKGN